MTLVVESTRPTQTDWHTIHYDFNLVVYSGKEISIICVVTLNPARKAKATAAKFVEVIKHKQHTQKATASD